MTMRMNELYFSKSTHSSAIVTPILEVMPTLFGLGSQANTLKAGPPNNGRTDVRTYGQNIPCILQDIVPLGPLPCLQLENLKKQKEKQGKGTADHILTLVDYFFL